MTDKIEEAEEDHLTQVNLMLSFGPTPARFLNSNLFDWHKRSIVSVMLKFKTVQLFL